MTKHQQEMLHDVIAFPVELICYIPVIAFCTPVGIVVTLLLFMRYVACA